MKKIVLMGNPNVGKSVVFTRLTGAHVIISNYPGTTVDYSQGTTRLDKEHVYTRVSQFSRWWRSLSLEHFPLHAPSGERNALAFRSARQSAPLPAHAA